MLLNRLLQPTYDTSTQPNRLIPERAARATLTASRPVRRGFRHRLQRSTTLDHLAAIQTPGEQAFDDTSPSFARFALGLRIDRRDDRGDQSRCYAAPPSRGFIDHAKADDSTL